MINNLRNIFYKKYIRFLYYLYYLKLKEKIHKIMDYSDKSWNYFEKDQEEQALPGFSKYLKTGYFKYMIGRYLFAIKFIKGKKVLDTGSGLGWGTYLISDYPLKVMGIDINRKAVEFSKKHWKNKLLSFKKFSVLDLEKLPGKYDVVLGYEIIEHLNYKDAEKYIAQISAVLKDNGILIMSSSFPMNKSVAKKLEKKNVFHKHIYTKEEIKFICLKYGLSNLKFLGNFMLIARK